MSPDLRRMRPSRWTCSRTVPEPERMIATFASGTFTPSLSTREVATIGYVPVVEPQQHLAPLLGLGLMGDDRDQEPPRDRVDCGVVVREDQDPVAVVAVEQVAQQAELGRGGQRELALLAVGQERLPAFGRAVRHEEELGPGVRPAHVDAR